MMTRSELSLRVPAYRPILDHRVRQQRFRDFSQRGIVHAVVDL
ncbi:hypothetical protein I551_8598 [Mycobacterium ulcerans str. Harvey]|uniref:Uncharacterized protein n=1 Tax=Mycobacterium ulcerans str. Harvey TaxID=1299332 RepID=A0ABN0RAQ3_MYCUL|nr:hypothetical protein I551_8598 [Mycobacterium ulcerans str. Harvey]